MFILIHGSNQTASRNLILSEAKKENVSQIKEYGISIEEISILETTLCQDIFGDKTLNVVNIARITKSQMEKLFNLLKRYPQSLVVLVTTKDLEDSNPMVKIVKALRGRVVSVAVERSNQVFKLLNNLFDKNESGTYKELKLLLEIDNDPVFILSMLQYQLRNITMAKLGLGDSLPKFQVNQAKRQATLFTEGKLFSLYEMLFNFDVGLKTGKILPDTIALVAISNILGR